MIDARDTRFGIVGEDGMRPTRLIVSDDKLPLTLDSLQDFLVEDLGDSSLVKKSAQTLLCGLCLAQFFGERHFLASIQPSFYHFEASFDRF